VSAEFDPTTTYVEFETGSPGSGLGGESQDRTRAYERFRLQRLVFRLSAQIIAPYEKPWLFPQAAKIVDEVLGGKVVYDEGVDRRELCNVRYLNLLRERIELAIRGEEGAGLLPVLDEYQALGSTDGIAFATAKLCEPTSTSHLSHAVCDSALERGIVRELELHDEVEAYVKNDRLFLEIPYRYFGRTRRYRPDFIVRLKSGHTLLIEGKGKPDEKDDAKATAARRWVEAVNAWEKLGTWGHAICTKRTEVASAISTFASQGAATI
jgi:type III restriction enzyme